MLKKEARLTTKDIQTLSQGKSVFGTLVSLRFAPAAVTKISISAAKKGVANAVDRNRIRRRVYAAAEPLLPLIKRPVSVLVIAKRECLTVPLKEISADLEAVFSKAGFLG